jgi:uncharacterized membrane protein
MPSVHSDTRNVSHEPVSNLLVKTILGAFTILAGFLLRDLITQSIESMVPKGAVSQITMTAFFTAFSLFIVVLMSWSLNDYIE